MAVKPYNPDDQEEPYANAGVGSDSTATDPNGSSAQADGPKPYTPPPTVAAPKTPSATDQGGDAPPVRTFAQMEAEGQARPPAPDPVQSGAMAPAVPTSPDPSQNTPAPMVGAPGSTVPDAPMAMPPGSSGELTQGATPGGAVVPGTQIPLPGIGPSGTMGSGAGPSGTMGGSGGPSGTMGSGGTDPSMLPPTSFVPPTTPSAPAGSTDAILSLLTGKATGTTSSPLQDATTQATLDQLKNPNPYNSDEVKREYDYLGGNIDDQYAQDQRAQLNADAQRGLYGSSGKDFESGRLADLNVGKRTAKESLANSLATAQAQSQGQYQANAINQGQAGANASNANQLDWLHSLMGYGNDAFNHDLQTAQFQQGQNNDEQDYLLQLLKAGYGA